jgi:hypothetical protein
MEKKVKYFIFYLIEINNLDSINSFSGHILVNLSEITF